MISKKVETVKKELYNINLPYFEFPAVYEILTRDIGALSENQNAEALKFFNFMFWDFRGENDTRIT